MSTLHKLADLYNTWLDENNLPHWSADEVLAGEIDLTQSQKDFLQSFITIWNYAEEKENN